MLMRSDSLFAVPVDHIDLDNSGTIDKHEMEVALRAAGKSMSEEQIDAMMAATDGDQNGDIDFKEFTMILKGVKASNAAMVIERQYHNHQNSQVYATTKDLTPRARKKALVKAAVPVTSSPRSAAAMGMPRSMDQATLEKMLGNALVKTGADPKELVEKWDRKRKGAISRIEFRVGVREGLGLNADNAAIDAFFDHFDKDSGGTIDVPELRDGLDWLAAREQKEVKARDACVARLKALKEKRDGLAPWVEKGTVALQRAFDEQASLVAHRGLPHVDCKVGVKLTSKLKSDENPKGVTFDDLVVAWDVARVVPGQLNKEEFVKAAAAVLSDVTMKRQKSEASQLKLDSATTVEDKEKVRANIALKEALGVESTQASADVEAQFDALDAQFAAAAAAEGEEPKLSGSVPIRQTIEVLMAADPARIEKDAALVDSCGALRDAALEVQAGVKQAVVDFEAREQAEAEALAAKLEADKKAEEEAAAAEKEAQKAKASEVQEGAQLAKMPRYLESATHKKGEEAQPVW